MRAAYIDMTNENNTCPQGLTYTVENSTHMCISSHSSAGCTSVTFPTHGVPTLRSVVEQLHTKKVQMMHFRAIVLGANDL